MSGDIDNTNSSNHNNNTSSSRHNSNNNKNSIHHQYHHEGDKVNISDWIAHAIADTGCEVVYGGHGGALVPLVNAICAHPKLTWVCARTEHDAATMAAAHAKWTGGLGVVIATSGPGATNLTTGLMEALMDNVSLLAITGMKPTAQLGYAEFQDVNQSRLFAGAGITWSKDAASPHAVLPLLRDAVSTALTQRTCAHLAIPVDIQAAPSPLPLKHFCASHANLRISSPTLDPVVLDAAAATLVGLVVSSSSSSPPTPTHESLSPSSSSWATSSSCPRTIVAVGLRAITGSGSNKNVSHAILELAEALNAPVLTRLHAKGAVDEFHPLSFGVIGVHGKPGLEAAATLIASSDRVLSIGIEDETLLLCNSAGLQIRQVIEMEPDAVAVSTRFNAEHTIVGNIEQACLALAERIRKLAPLVEEQRAKQEQKVKQQQQQQRALHYQMSKTLDHFSYMAHHSPDTHEIEMPNGERQLSRPLMDELGIQGLMDNSKLLWDAFHAGEWRKLLPSLSDDNNKLPEVPTHSREKSESSIRYDCDVTTIDSSGSTSKYCHPAEVLGALSRARLDESVDPVSRNAVIAVDVGDITLWASLCLNLRGGSRTLYSERLGTMGYALCAGIAGILAQPAPAAAVVLAGDGGFQMTLSELAAFQQVKRPGDKLLCIVFDNQLLGRVIFGFDNALGCEMTGPDYVQLAKAYGGDGIRLDSNDEADQVVRQAMAAEKEGLFLIHVIVDPTIKADMASFQDKSLQVMNSG